MRERERERVRGNRQANRTTGKKYTNKRTANLKIKINEKKAARLGTILIT